MSKKVVSFTLPPDRVRKDTPQTAEADREPAPSSPQASDNWVLSPAPRVKTSSSVMVDLSASRTWFELVGLISIFPYLATSCWMQTATQTWLASVKRR
jgi:hypothetical protein